MCPRLSWRIRRGRCFFRTRTFLPGVARSQCRPKSKAPCKPLSWHAARQGKFTQNVKNASDGTRCGWGLLRSLLDDRARLLSTREAQVQPCEKATRCDQAAESDEYGTPKACLKARALPSSPVSTKLVPGWMGLAGQPPCFLHWAAS